MKKSSTSDRKNAYRWDRITSASTSTTDAEIIRVKHLWIQSENSRSSTPHTKNTTEQHNGGGGENKDGYGDSVENDRLHAQIKELRSELDKSRRDNQKSRDKVKKLSRENHAATKSYTVRDGKCPFCQQEMPTKNRK